MWLDAATYQRVLGDEIRRLRKQRGWTRKELTERLPGDLSLQTLATYELGTRQCSVVRFVEICLALEELPHELVARVHERVFLDTPVTVLRIDLRTLAHDQAPDLLPLRRWATHRLAELTSAQSTEVQLDSTALDRMAELCRIATLDLIARLRQLSATHSQV